MSTLSFVKEILSLQTTQKPIPTNPIVEDVLCCDSDDVCCESVERTALWIVMRTAICGYERVHVVIDFWWDGQDVWEWEVKLEVYDDNSYAVSSLETWEEHDSFIDYADDYCEELEDYVYRINKTNLFISN